VSASASRIGVCGAGVLGAGVLGAGVLGGGALAATCARALEVAVATVAKPASATNGTTLRPNLLTKTERDMCATLAHSDLPANVSAMTVEHGMLARTMQRSRPMSCQNVTTHTSLTKHALAIGLMSATFACKNDPDPKTGNVDPAGSSNLVVPSASQATSAAPTATPVTTASNATVRPAESAPPAKPPAFPGAKAGEMCGGIAVIPCAEGLRCVVSGPMFPDKSGVCIK
jgi:hypothetical protein